MPRSFLEIAFDGTAYAGWQVQPHSPSIQAEVERALAVALGEEQVEVTGCGRTDAGVHALAMRAHIDVAKDIAPFRLMEALNWHLKPAPVAVLAAARVDDDFHARFSAIERRYTFRLVARRAPVVRDSGLVWQVRHRLDLTAMQEAAAALVGTHDFTTFRATLCQARSPVKSLDELTVEEHPYPAGQEFRFHLRARSFLHNQVRSIVGTLERVGAGAWAPERVAEALAARDRAACGPVCPPQGLTLTGVTYPDDPFTVRLPATGTGTGNGS